MTNDRPRTAADIAALPEGAAFYMARHTVTDKDHQSGYTEVGGKRIAVQPGIKTITFPVSNELVAFYSDETDVIQFTDADGEVWKLGRYADGRWVRIRA